MILSRSIKHGWYYHYKIESEKVSKVKDAGFDDLHSFLYKVRSDRPDHLFNKGPRSSQMDLSHNLTVEETTHPISQFARMGLESNYYDDNHMNVQMFMLGYDRGTFAMEVPIWLSQDDAEGYTNILETEEALTGHIDILRLEEDTIWIWDYKPKAHTEKTAHFQVALYTIMLHVRTGVPWNNLRCGYFDDKKVFEVSINDVKGIYDSLKR